MPCLTIGLCVTKPGLFFSVGGSYHMYRRLQEDRFRVNITVMIKEAARGMWNMWTING